MNGRVLTITQGAIEEGTVPVAGGRIVVVGDVILEDFEIYDASGKVVMPGLIDAHCHVGLWGEGGRSSSHGS